MSGTSSLIRAPLWPVVGAHRHLLYVVTHPEVQGVFLPAGRGDRWLVGSALDAAAQPTEADVVALVRRGAGVDDLPVEIERSQRWTAATQLAEHFRAGRVFLAGDAAHRVTPRGGTGLNLALRDGFDLGWRLAWVLRGWAPAALLDDYEAERRPVAARAVERSADPLGSRRPTEQEVVADLGGRIAHAWTDGGSSTLDLLGPGLTLFARRAGHAPVASAAARAGRPPLLVRRLDDAAAAALGVAGDDGLLVRADGRPLARIAGERAAVAV